MSWGSVSKNTTENGRHGYSIHEPQELPTWINAVATEYVGLRTACTVTLTEPLNVSGVGTLSVDDLNKRLAKACVPKPDIDRGNFSVSRADLSEVAAYMTLERDYGTALGYKLVRDREAINLPGRGIDAIGIEDGEKLVIVLTEVKFSNESCSPKAPQVVDSASETSMRNQHIGHLNEIEITANKLWECARKTTDPALQKQYMTAAIYLEGKQWDHVEVVACCVLVRPKQCHSSGDFGSFLSSPDDFTPASVRFIIIALPADLDEVLKPWADTIETKRSAS